MNVGIDPVGVTPVLPISVLPNLYDTAVMTHGKSK